jgi:uncharacterized protein YjdB
MKKGLNKRIFALAMAFVFLLAFAAGCGKPVEPDTVAVTGVSLDKDKLALVAGNSETLTATVAPADASNKNVSWISSDTAVATVANGTVTAVAAGSAVIKAASAENAELFDECDVTVTAAPIRVTGLTLSAATFNFVVGGGDTLTATVLPADATNKAVTWTSSDPEVAAVNNGAIEALTLGATVIRATSDDVATIYAECAVSVVPGDLVPATGVTLNLGTASVAAGSTITLTAEIAPIDASNKNISWIVHDPSVASVSEGEVSGIRMGTAWVKAAVSANTALFDECEVTVTNAYGATFYNNADFHNYGDLVTPTIENQWEGYGIGDPFIMRYNGMFYLYASTLDAENGVRAWKSVDLVNWTICNPSGANDMPMGYVVSDQDFTTKAAYAPEVYYWNGLFYMYMSPAGNGHYVYTADSPEGPFTAATGNFGMSIDGSVFIDDDERMYFTHAGSGGIQMRTMTDMLNIAGQSAQINSSNIGGWTEGSYVLRRGDTLYMTYTGNHVASDAYRVSYVYADADAFASASTNSNRAGTFTQGMDLPILLETDNPNQRGLGHSATVMGPDMDSYYMAYHNLNSSGGPNRSLNIDRILFNGKQMSVTPTLYNAIAPKLPVFRADNTADVTKFELAAGKAVSKVGTGDVFTAEFNFSGVDAMTLAVNYVDDNHYDAIDVDLTAKTITLSKVVDGTKTVVGSGALVNSFDPAALHTVRYAQKDGRADVYFDNLRKIKEVSAEGNGGKIAYLYDGNPQLYYTAFSDVARGLSDQNEVKQAAGAIGAALYSQKTGDSLLTGSGGVGVAGAGAYNNAAMLTLGNTGDYADYYVNFTQEGYWGLEMTYPRSFAGKSVKITVENTYLNDPAQTLVLPASAASTSNNNNYSKAYLGTFRVWNGVNKVRVESADGEVGFVSFTFFEATTVAPNFSHDLNTYMGAGSDYRTIWKLAGENGADGHRGAASTRQLVFIGDSTITDFTLEVKIKFIGENLTSSAGIVFRADNYASSAHDNNNSIQGYYLKFTNNNGTRTTIIEKLNYGTAAVASAPNQGPLVDTWMTVKLVVRGDNFKVYLNGSETSLFSSGAGGNDACGFTHGRIGLYTTGAEVCFKDLVITP